MRVCFYMRFQLAVGEQTDCGCDEFEFELCGSCLYSLSAGDRHSAAYTTGVKNMQLNFSHFVCYRNNVVCLKCMPSEQNAVGMVRIYMIQFRYRITCKIYIV